MVLLPPDDLPELGADLVTTLASLNVHNFSHAVGEEENSASKIAEFPTITSHFTESQVLSHHLKHAITRQNSKLSYLSSYTYVSS